jgi:hypothetical protein
LRSPHESLGCVEDALLAVVAGVGVLIFAGGAESAFPGVNGRIAFTSHRDGNFEI